MIWQLLIASVSMIVTDILGVMLVQAEARNHGWLAGSLDAAQWIPGIVCSEITITILQGNSWAGKIWVVLAVSAANIFGTKLGQLFGTKYIKDIHAMTTKQKVDDLLERMEAVERVSKIAPPTGE